MRVQRTTDEAHRPAAQRHIMANLCRPALVQGLRTSAGQALGAARLDPCGLLGSKAELLTALHLHIFTTDVGYGGAAAAVAALESLA